MILLPSLKCLISGKQFLDDSRVIQSEGAARILDARRSEEGDDSNKCKQCGVAITDQAMLRKHIDERHVHTD